jgi:CspA family cold shock protein
MSIGTVKWFNSRKGYGFIQPQNGGKDVFVHITKLEEIGLRRLYEGQKISYEIYDDRGRTAAGNLEIL